MKKKRRIPKTKKNNLMQLWAVSDASRYRTTETENERSLACCKNASKCRITETENEGSLACCRTTETENERSLAFCKNASKCKKNVLCNYFSIYVNVQQKDVLFLFASIAVWFCLCIFSFKKIFGAAFAFRYCHPIVYSLTRLFYSLKYILLHVSLSLT